MCVLMLALAETVAAGTVEVRYSFAEPKISQVLNAYCAVDLDGCETLESVGKPKIPFRTARILLPSGASVKGVEFELVAPVQMIELDAPVAFGRTPIPIRADEVSGLDEPSPLGTRGSALASTLATAALDEPDPAVYAQDFPYPASRVQLMSVQKLHGYSVAIVRVFPVQYRPLSAKILFCPELTVSVVLNETRVKAAATSIRGASPERTTRVMDFVDNPQEVVASGLQTLSTPLDLGSVDYLLITAAALTNAFQPLVENKISAGLAVKVATVEEIRSGQAGRDDAEKLRNYIRSAYTNWGVTYVLLGGDVGTVPYRAAYAYCQGAEPNMPCDLYFACLDGSWNSDGDSYWGEPTDGEGGGDVDLVAEVYVGRAPVDTVAEAVRFVEKTVRYEQGGHGNAEQGLFLGGQLGGGAQGGDALDPLLPSFAEFTISWLDDRPAITDVWTKAEAMAALNASPHVVADFGHANKTFALRMSVGDLAGLTNADPFLLNSGGCDAGWFDYEDCFAETMVKGNAAGAFAVVMNTRYGWYSGVDEARFTGEFMRKFFNWLLVQEAGSIGAAHFLSKQDMIGRVEKSGDMPYRWCYFESTLFGDPHVALQRDALDVQPEEGYPATGYVGGPFAPVQKAYALSNSSTGVLAWSASYSTDWLSVLPASGLVDAGATAEVVLSFNAHSEGLLPGAYTDTVILSNTVSGYTRSVPVNLSVYGNISLQSAAYSTMEAEATQVLITVIRGSNTNLAATVDFATLDGTALAGCDYVATNGTLVFFVGEASRMIAVDILNDEVTENNKTFKLVLSNPTGFATLQAPYEAVVTIRDDDWLDHFEWSGVEPEQTVGKPFEVTASAINRTGGVLTGFSDACTLYATRGSAVESEVPGSTNRWNYPMSCYKQDARTQAIYTPEEVGGAGLLTGLSLYVWKQPAIPLNEWTIRVKQTARAQYDAATWRWETNDWVVAVQTNVSFSTIGWKRFGFTTPFVYDGTNKLMVDFTIDNSTSASPDGECYAALVSTNRCLFARRDGDYGDPLFWNGRAPSGAIIEAVPGARFERRSLVWMMPEQTGTFASGVWTGEAAVREAATNVVLSLYDGAGHGGSSAVFDVAWLGLADWLAGYGIPSDGSADDGDDDGDGFLNRDEWVAGTDPTNGLARLCIEQAGGTGADGAFAIRWQSVPGKRYRVESAETLLPPLVFTPFVSNVLGTARSTEVKDMRPEPDGSRFYRIVVE